MSEENTLNAEPGAAPWTSSDVPIVVQGPYIPEYATEGAAGFDLRAHAAPDELLRVYEGHTLLVPTGLKFQIPEGYELQIRPRSGLARQGLVAQFGTVDSDYRGEVKVIMHNNSYITQYISPGDRIAQAVLAPVTRAVFTQGVVDENETERGSNGFGSTGS